MISPEQKEHLLKSLAKGKRYDGRGLLEFRPVTVEFDISKSAEGSARVKIGNTEVLAGVKMAIEKPYPDTPDHGNLMVNAELYAMSSPKFEPGPPSDQSIEIARVIDRGIREAKAIDVHKLCLKAGEKVWSVMIDVVTVNDEGNILDAGALAALAALKNAKFPKHTDDVIDYLTKTDEPLPIMHEPIAITVYKIGSFFIVDPLPEEEEAYDARLTITLTQNEDICALQKGGAAPLTIDEVDQMVALALQKAPELRKLIK